MLNLNAKSYSSSTSTSSTSATGNLVLGNAKRLKALLDVVSVDAEAMPYAQNELRGLFFSSLCTSTTYDAHLQFILRRSVPKSSAKINIDELAVSEEMMGYLDSVVAMSSLFTRAFFVYAEDIPSTFRDAIAACGVPRD